MKKISFYSVILIFLLISMFFIEIPVFATKAIWSAIQKDCFKNIRNLTIAIEKYNKDHSSKVDTILPGRDYEDFEKILIKEKYLDDILYRTEDKCSYGIINFIASETVFCKKHGVIDGPAPSIDEEPKLPKYNTSLEKPFSKEYEEKQIKHLNRAQFFRKIGNFLYPLLQDPGNTLFYIIIMVVLAVTIKILAFPKIKK